MSITVVSADRKTTITGVEVGHWRGVTKYAVEPGGDIFGVMGDGPARELFGPFDTIDKLDNAIVGFYIDSYTPRTCHVVDRT